MFTIQCWLEPLKTAAVRNLLKHSQEKLRQDFKAMREEVDELLKGRRPFHWPLEFPEVFVVGEEGFAAIMSNPPFQGIRMIAGTLRTSYREYL